MILSIPVFVLAVLLEILAVKINNVAGTKIFEYTGEITPGLDGGFWTHALDRLKHLVLPSLTLILGEIAFYGRYQRNAMLDVLGSDFLRTAQAKGSRAARRRSSSTALRTALIPMATFFAYSSRCCFVGATFTEKIFGWHGMGEYFVDSVTKNDVNSVAARHAVRRRARARSPASCRDVAYAPLDPRVRV